MLKRLMGCIREFKKPTILTLVFIVCESIIETLIPFITAALVNDIQDGLPLSNVIKKGVLLAIMAFASLACGGIAGFCCARASAGFAKNLRHDLYDRVGRFSFENVDRFSSTSLVTRMTTDVQNVQMSYMMIIRTAIRAPLMLIFSVIMAFVMGGTLAMTFVVIIPILAIGLWLVGKKALPAFRRVFRKYDRLNESIEENVRGMRVVKGFSREEREKEKFGIASEDIRADFTHAERIVAWNRPIMQFCMYFNMIFVLLVGSKLIISVGELGVGELSAMLTYGMQVLMSLMMLSMIYVILTISAESVKRIDEVLCEAPSLSSPESGSSLRREDKNADRCPSSVSIYSPKSCIELSIARFSIRPRYFSYFSSYRVPVFVEYFRRTSKNTPIFLYPPPPEKTLPLGWTK